MVGVVIVNFYSASYLRRCLQALAAQTERAETILVVNNGDDPDALVFIEQHYPSVRILDQNNIGFAAANNLAIEQLDRHEWIALLNPDAFPEPTWLEELLLATRTYPNAAIFSSMLLQADNPALLDGEGDAYHLSGLAWRSHHGCPAHNDGQHVREVFSACAAAALYKREALIAVKGFDPAYFCYFEDVDLGFRLRLRGYQCLQIPAAKVLHVGGACSGEKKQSDFALYHGHRNLVWTFVKNMPGYWFWLLLPAHALLNLVSLIWFIGKGRGRVIVRAKFDALKAMRAVWAQRKAIQAQRAASATSILRRMSFWPLTFDR